MSYQVLARRYRPQRFADVIGQDHVVRALANALDQQRLHHAYLLTGTRGVGKTTLARIFAKALNCQKGISAEPCGECAACVEISQGRFADFIELDAASHTGIDNMREIMDGAQYVPTAGRFKIYLIDEVHMLSKAAFNAILKTLEEPPAHVKFILATTDPQRIPITVLSRCLQFNLKQMSPAEIGVQMQKVLNDEGIEYEAPALQLIARNAEGSMRDALSLLDQAIAYGAGKVGEDTVRAMLAAVDASYLFSLLEALAAHDATRLISEIDAIAARSVDFEIALQELAILLHRVALAQTLPDAVLEDTAERERIVDLAQRIDAEMVQLYYQIALNGRRDFAVAPDAYAGFSMPLLRMFAFTPERELSASSRAPTPAKPARPEPTQPQARASAAQPAAVRSQPAVSPVAEVTDSPAGDATSAPVTFDGDWLALVGRLKAGGMARMLAEQCEVKSFADGALLLCINEAHRHLFEKPYQEKLRQELRQLLGAALRVQFELGSVSGMTPARVAEDDRAARLAKAKAAIDADPYVQGLVSGLGAQVIESSIKPID